jgi:hypothetical protein
MLVEGVWDRVRSRLVRGWGDGPNKGFLEQPQSFAIHLHPIENGDFLRGCVKTIYLEHEN